MSLLPVAGAQARLLALGAAMPVETVAPAAAAGRWTAGDVVARRDQPAADLSAMDGYALRFAELPGPLAVTGEAAAGGAAPPALGPGEAARIFTGAPLPPGADTILIQEEAARDGDRVTLAGDGPPRRGAHVRPRGSDFRRGARLVAGGELLTPARIALAVLGGHGTIAVRRRPRVAILATGDELVAPGAWAGAGGGLPASNTPMLAALIGGIADIADGGIVPDDLATLAAALADAAATADVVVTTGGASVGDHDLVRPALAAAGAEMDFWRVAMKPGKPIMAGRIGATVMLGLPGNPVSAYVTALLFLLPLLRRMAGAAEPLPTSLRAPLATPLPATGGRADYLRARMTGDGALAVAAQDSAAVAGLAEGSHLIVRPPHAPAAVKGDPAEILALA